jgi:hypothetical protein
MAAEWGNKPAIVFNNTEPQNPLEIYELKNTAIY